MSVTAPTRLLEQEQKREEQRKAAEDAKRPKINPYLAHTVVDDGGSKNVTQKQQTSITTAATTSDTTTDIQKQSSSSQQQKQSTEIIDYRLANGQITKNRQRHRPINFITPGTYIALGEKKREMASRAEESGYISAVSYTHLTLPTTPYV